MTSRSRASTSAGPAPSSRRSSAPHSAVTTVSPPSVSTSTSGTVRPVACRSRHVVRAATRSRRASSSTTSESGASTSADGSMGRTRMRCESRPSAGSTSTEPPVAGVRMSRSAIRHLLPGRGARAAPPGVDAWRPGGTDLYGARHVVGHVRGPWTVTVSRAGRSHGACLTSRASALPGR
ncbi:Uncharacterised protein [Mycobacteroides abscessus]|nr:Uncharacterised protein [Mycobacteroides abscessus]